jgi:branched-chain amino acid transport system ATP-binding protein
LPGSPKPDPILKVDRIVRRFGGMTAVDVNHLEVQRGAITALIGPNGAGKTTFFNLLTGFDKPSSTRKRKDAFAAEGAPTWEFDGKELASTSAYRVAQAGMVRTFQLTKALSAMTVLDNMLLGSQQQFGEKMSISMAWPAWKPRERELTEKAEEILDRFKLLEKRDDYAGSLSGGQRKLLEMARALMSDPRMIMLDEPMAGVNPALTQSLLGHIESLREEGTTVLFVEHDMHMVQRISDWVVVMAEGRIVAEGNPREVMQNQAVIDAYLGSHRDDDLGDDALLDEDMSAAIAAEDEAIAAALAEQAAYVEEVREEEAEAEEEADAEAPAEAGAQADAERAAPAQKPAAKEDES